MTWSTPQVMDETRRRLRQARLTWQEPVTLWDVDRPEDLDRLRACGLGGLLLLIAIKRAGSAPARPRSARAAITRFARSGSLSNTTAMMAPNSTLVSRSAATIAIGATVIAQIAMP